MGSAVVERHAHVRADVDGCVDCTTCHTYRSQIALCGHRRFGAEAWCPRQQAPARMMWLRLLLLMRAPCLRHVVPCCTRQTSNRKPNSTAFLVNRKRNETQLRVSDKTKRVKLSILQQKMRLRGTRTHTHTRTRTGGVGGLRAAVLQMSPRAGACSYWPGHLPRGFRGTIPRSG